VGLERLGETTIVTANLDRVVGWARKNSLWPLTFGLACCAIEMIATAAARYDMARFGMEVFRPSPRQADDDRRRYGDRKMASAEALYDQMAEPKWVVASACRAGYSRPCRWSRGRTFLPVDVYIPGCPVKPEALLDGLIRLQEKIAREAGGGAR
jgi:NADH-quinone oxidoreductase subunit B